jgi:putative hemolysin
MLKLDKFSVHLAQTDDDIKRVQALRYEVFYNELKAKPLFDGQTLDQDGYDTVCDHLMVIDDETSEVVGTYRLIRQEMLPKDLNFYTSNEYNLSRLLSQDKSLVEVGRSCVHKDYRVRPVMTLLWHGLGAYMKDHSIDYFFGFASFEGNDVKSLALPLSFLYHYHLADKAICPRALDEYYVDMNKLPIDQVDKKEAWLLLPPLIKGYLRAGCMIGDGAFIDEQFSTVDVCIIMNIGQVTERYYRRFGR